MLLEYWITSANDSHPYGCVSWIALPAVWKRPRSQKKSSPGVTTRSSIAAAARIALNVEPGS